jgi:diacylglycerol kinase (ATP)
VVNTPQGRTPRPGGLGRIWRAFGNTLKGLRAAVRDEAAFRQELALAVVVIPAGLWLGRSGVERALLAGTMVLVLVVELLNSAIEAAVDRVGIEHHPLSGQAKDIGSAAVFIAFVLMICTWALILLDL